MAGRFRVIPRDQHHRGSPTTPVRTFALDDLYLRLACWLVRVYLPGEASVGVELSAKVTSSRTQLYNVDHSLRHGITQKAVAIFVDDFV